MEVHILLHRRQ